MRFEVTDEERRLLTVDDGVVVAWFDDPAMAVRVARLLNGEESLVRSLATTTEVIHQPDPVHRQNLDDVLGAALREQERHNPFCQRDGCLHRETSHGNLGLRWCQRPGCVCSGFMEAT